MDTATLRQLFGWPISGRVIYWIFASFVFGAYVISLEAALLESIGFYGPMRIFTTAILANMVLPIQISIYVWFVGSVLHVLGQLATKRIDRDTAPFSVGSLILSLWSVTVAISLSDVKVPWFVGYLQLTDTTKLVVGMVSAFALAYVIYTPFFVWKKNEIRRSATQETGVPRLLELVKNGGEVWVVGTEYSRWANMSYETIKNLVILNGVSFTFLVADPAPNPDPNCRSNLQRAIASGLIDEGSVKAIQASLIRFRDLRYDVGEKHRSKIKIRLFDLPLAYSMAIAFPKPPKNAEAHIWPYMYEVRDPQRPYLIYERGDLEHRLMFEKCLESYLYVFGNSKEA